MAELKIINIATVHGTDAACGKVIWLHVGNTRVRFFLQYPVGDNSGAEFLTHYASGQKVGSIKAYKVKHFRSYVRITDREAAAGILENITKAKGVEAVLSVLNAAPVINK